MTRIPMFSELNLLSVQACRVGDFQMDGVPVIVERNDLISQIMIFQAQLRQGPRPELARTCLELENISLEGLILVDIPSEIVWVLYIYKEWWFS